MKRFLNEIKPTPTITKELNENDNKPASFTSKPKKLQDIKHLDNEKWKRTIIPGKLNNKETFELFENFLGKIEDKDREKMRKTFIEYKITGKELVAVSKSIYKHSLKALVEDLQIPPKYKVYFDNMMAFIEAREKELNENNIDVAETENTSQKNKYYKEDDESCELSEATKNPSKAELNTGTEVATGTKLKMDKTVETTIKNVTVEKFGANNVAGSEVGLDVESTDNAKLDIGSINVKADYRNQRPTQKLLYLAVILVAWLTYILCSNGFWSGGEG